MENNIVRTMLTSIKLIDEKILKIKEIDNEKYEEMKKRLDEAQNNLAEKKAEVVDIINELMGLLNETIIFLDMQLEEKEKEKELQAMQLAIPNKPNIFVRIINRIKEFFAKHNVQSQLE